MVLAHGLFGFDELKLPGARVERLRIAPNGRSGWGRVPSGPDAGLWWFDLEPTVPEARLVSTAPLVGIGWFEPLSRLANTKGIELDPKSVETNIVIFSLAFSAPDAATVVARAKEQSLLVNAVSARKIRAVTHLDVTKAQCEEAATRLTSIVR